MNRIETGFRAVAIVSELFRAYVTGGIGSRDINSQVEGQICAPVVELTTPPIESLVPPESEPINSTQICFAILPEKTKYYIQDATLIGTEDGNIALSLADMSTHIMDEQILAEQLHKAIHPKWFHEPAMVKQDVLADTQISLQNIHHLTYHAGFVGFPSTINIIGTNNEGLLVSLSIPVGGLGTKFDDSDPNTFKIYHTDNKVHVTDLELNFNTDTSRNLYSRLIRAIVESPVKGHGLKGYISPKEHTDQLNFLPRENDVVMELGKIRQLTPTVDVLFSTGQSYAIATGTRGEVIDMTCDTQGRCWLELKIDAFDDFNQNGGSPFYTVWVEAANFVGKPESPKTMKIYPPTATPIPESMLFTPTPTPNPTSTLDAQGEFDTPEKIKLWEDTHFPDPR